MKPPLPIDGILDQLTSALDRGGAVVLRAPTGAGKTTRVPPALLAGSPGKVLVLQPRRIAARATAARMAAENGWQLGQQVGYHVRFDRRSGPDTRIEAVTEGILLQRLHHDPFLEEVGTIVFDEFHERNLNSDLALGMVRQVQQTVRPELRIAVMSATLDAEPIARYLGGCPAVECSVPAHPVAIRYAAPPPRQPLHASAAAGVLQVLDETPGDVLVFLPGLREIRQTRNTLASAAAARRFVLAELYGDLPADQQDAALTPGPQRRVILATNVAETSLTIAGVTAVVDTGWARQQRFDPRVGLDRLQLTPISRAAADQRAGRAGRTAPGICLRLWDPRVHAARPAHEEPEIRRVDLAAAVLQLLCWIEPDVTGFPWFEPPRPDAVDQALALLRRLDAAGPQGVTRLGRRLASLPLHPRLGRLLLEGYKRGCPRRAALAAAVLSERSPFVREDAGPAGHSAGPRRVGFSPPRFAREDGGSAARNAAAANSDSDLLDRVIALEQFEQAGHRSAAGGRLHAAAAKTVLQVRDQLLRQAARRTASERATAAAEKEGDQPLLQALLAAFPDRLARRRQPGSRQGLMVGGRGVRLAEESAVLEAPLFLCLEVDRGRSEALVRCASAVQRAWLPEKHVTVKTELFFDAEARRVSARRRVYWEDLLLEESTAGCENSAETARLLAEAARQDWPRVWAGLDPAVRSFVARVRCLQQWLPELDLPPLDDAGLHALLPELCRGCRSLDQLQQAAWLPVIKSLFRHDQLQAIEREAPARLAVPGGRQVAIGYEPGKPPVLAARIQELFGWTRTPRIARGRVPLLLHLLAPNMRPQQITDDLESFWKNTYPRVRKELRGRYPKHAWPELPTGSDE